MFGKKLVKLEREVGSTFYITTISKGKRDKMGFVLRTKDEQNYIHAQLNYFLTNYGFGVDDINDFHNFKTSLYLKINPKKIIGIFTSDIPADYDV